MVLCLIACSFSLAWTASNKRAIENCGLFAFEDLTLEGDLSDIEAVTKQIGERSPRKWDAADSLACLQRANLGDECLISHQ